MQQIKSVLLVDDDPASNFLAQLLLRKLDKVLHVSVTANGKEALDYLREQHGKSSFPDLILLDINMPIMDGFEFMDHFQQLPLNQLPRVVILSSSVSPKDAQRAMDYRVNGFINKPLTKERLAQILQG